MEHGVYVNAVNRYHAFAVAMRELTNCSWSKPDSNVQELQMELLDKKPTGGRRQRIFVTRDQFEAWLGMSIGVGTDRLRDHIKMLLGRMPPDRDFKRAIQER